MIFFIFISAVVYVFVYSPDCIAKKNVAQMSSNIAVANSVWERSSNSKRMIIGNAFCCFMPVYSFVHPLKVCSDNNDN